MLTILVIKEMSMGSYDKELIENMIWKISMKSLSRNIWSKSGNSGKVQSSNFSKSSFSLCFYDNYYHTLQKCKWIRVIFNHRAFCIFKDFC